MTATPLNSSDGQASALTVWLECEDSSWRPLRLSAVPALVLSGGMTPRQRVRLSRGEEDEFCLGRDLPGVPLDQLARQCCQRLARRHADMLQSSPSLTAEAASISELRQWADGADTAPVSVNARRRIRHLADFLEALIAEWEGDSGQAVARYRGIAAESPDDVSWPLWFAASHNLASRCLALGRHEGIGRLCQLIELGREKPHMTSGPTLFNFRQLLLHLAHRSRREHRQVTRATIPFAEPDEWQPLYTRAAEVLRERILELGLGTDEEHWPLAPPPWSEAAEEASFCAGPGLTVVHARDIADLQCTTPEEHQRHETFRTRLVDARRAADAGQLREADVLAEAILADVPDDESYAELSAEASRTRESVQQELRLSELRSEALAQQQRFSLLQRTQDESLPVAEVAQAQIAELDQTRPAGGSRQLGDAVAQSLADRRSRIRRQEQDELIESVQQRLAANDLNDAALLAVRLEGAVAERVSQVVGTELGRAHFARGIELLDRDTAAAESALFEAARRDPRYHALVAPLLAASALHQSEIHQLFEARSSLRDHLSDLQRCGRSLIENSLSTADAQHRLWDVFQELVDDLVEADSPAAEAVSAIIEALERQVEQAPGRADLLDHIQVTLVRIAEGCPEHARLRSPVYLLEARVHSLRSMAAGRLLLRSDLVAAAQYFATAITAGPELDEAWELLAECLLHSAEISPREKVRAARSLADRLADFDEPARERRREDPETWIREQLVDFGVTPDQLRPLPQSHLREEHGDETAPGDPPRD